MKNSKFLIFVLFLFLSFVSLRTILLTPGTVGHNWDWFTPASVVHLQHFLQSLPFTWRGFSLGEPISLWLPSMPFFFFVTLPSFFGLGGEFISKFLMVSTIVLSGFGMFLLLENMVGRRFSSFLGGFFYAFSPFLFAEFIGGAATQFFAYALMPWLLFFVRKLNQKDNFFLYLLLSSLILSLITISLQVLVLSSTLLGLYLLIQENKLKYLKNLFFLYLAYFFLNLYWIIPTIVEYTNIYKTVSDAPSFSFFTIQNLVPSLTEAFISVGYTRPFFLAVIGEKLLPFWLLIVYLGVAFIFFKLLRAGKNKENFFWFLIFLLSLIFATGGKEPLGDQVVWLYQHFPLMSLFRSPQHFIVLPIFVMAILIGFAFGRSNNKSIFRKVIPFLFILFWLYPFFISGDLGSKRLMTKKMEHVDVYRLSPGYQEIFKFLDNDKTDYKVLFLPMAGSPSYLKTPYQSESQGGDPLIEYSFKDTITADISYGSQGKELANALDKIVCDKKDSRNLGEVLGLMNMKYIILRKDVAPHFTECKSWDWQGVYQFLSANPDLIELKNLDHVIFFENKKNMAHFFAINKTANMSNNVQDFFQNKPVNIAQLTAEISFKKINPTRYEVQVNKANEPYFLIFSESFNSYWKIYPENSNWFTKPLFEDQHLKVNSFANAWLINKTGSYKLVIDYWPQRFFYLGAIFSSLSFLVLLGLTLKVYFLKRVKYNRV